MTVDLSVEIDESDAVILALVAGADGRALEAYVAALVHAEALRLRQAEASSRLADRRYAVQDTWFPSPGLDAAAGEGENAPVADQIDD
ncbi:hypothetical protein [Raineyella sp. LH-20]|uniref:hypothetical protein n=1 Tax=Raineyella sp. LH-20 TaxID=3081204 RepID=UPI002953ACBD|nr:hypothetical protein [Raineyella sp. LH-20]WOP18896.1 hypothetical protein R0146_01070 [Raineyella sp. LH-20]